MKTKNIKKILEKQGHRFVGNHSSIKICRWTRKSLVDAGVCYKEKFYGIKSHLCCQMSPWIACQNQCIHCWRPIEFDFNQMIKKVADSPQEIIEGCIQAQRKLLTGFKGNKKVNKAKLKQSKEPMQFAISLIGEPTLYPKLGEFIKELRKRGKTSFLVTNGLQPAVLSRLNKERNLPTQLYLSLNASNKKLYDKWHKSRTKNAWKKFNESLKLMDKLKCRTVIRMTLVKDINMKDSQIQGYMNLIKKAKPDFIEVKGFVSVGFSRKRLGYELMPTHEEIRDYAERIAIELNERYKILDEHKFSKVVLIGKNKSKVKIRKKDI